MKPWDSKRFLAAPTGGRYRYVPFHQLTPSLQRQVRGAYPHKAVGAMYDFADEHYYYPLTKDGRVPIGGGRSTDRYLAIPQKLIVDSPFMASLGYKMNPGWPRDARHGNVRSRRHGSVGSTDEQDEEDDAPMAHPEDFSDETLRAVEYWYGGQFTDAYSVLSMRGDVPVNTVEGAALELEHALSQARAKNYRGFKRSDIDELKGAIDSLNYIASSRRAGHEPV